MLPISGFQLLGWVYVVERAGKSGCATRPGRWKSTTCRWLLQRNEDSLNALRIPGVNSCSGYERTEDIGTSHTFDYGCRFHLMPAVNLDQFKALVDAAIVEIQRIGIPTVPHKGTVDAVDQPPWKSPGRVY